MSPPLVLIVEDEFLVRLLAVSLLEEAGFSTIQAGSADEAIALLEARKDIRVVFTDINMPGSMDGLRLAHAIRYRWPPIELVLTSGHIRVGKEDMPERGLFLAKPMKRLSWSGRCGRLCIRMSWLLEAEGGGGSPQTSPPSRSPAAVHTQTRSRG